MIGQQISVLLAEFLRIVDAHTFDLLLVLGVSVQGTALAYVHNPRVKGFIMSLPIPFTIASLSLGEPINATHALGLGTLWLYVQGVRILYYRFRVPILASIVLSAAGYCAIGWGIVAVIPEARWLFWVSAISVVGAGIALFAVSRPREEPGHRSRLPVPVKLCVIVGIVAALVVLKGFLRGFMTVFPYNGVIAAYEARKSLWTISRQITVVMSCLGSMMITVHVVEMWCSRGVALALGWVVFSLIALPFFRIVWRGEARERQTV